MATIAATKNPSPRTKRMKDFLLSCPMEVDFERARFYTESWQRTEKETGFCSSIRTRGRGFGDSRL